MNWGIIRRNEQMLLGAEHVLWVSRNSTDINDFILTDKRGTVKSYAQIYLQTPAE